MKPDKVLKELKKWAKKQLKYWKKWSEYWAKKEGLEEALRAMRNQTREVTFKEIIRKIREFENKKRIGEKK